MGNFYAVNTVDVAVNFGQTGSSLFLFVSGTNHRRAG